MLRLLEKILNLKEGFLSKGSEFSIQFNPHWPFQDKIGGAVMWNIVLGGLAALLVIWVYRREGRSRGARVFLGCLRALLLAFILAMLNRPTLARMDSESEPSVLAVLMDGTVSMQVKDGGTDERGQPLSRFDSVMNLLTGDDRKLLKDLSAKHNLRFYRFDSDAESVGQFAGRAPAASPISTDEIVEKLSKLKPDGDSTRVYASLRTVLQKLQGEHLAGVALLTDGRDNPDESRTENIEAIRKFGVRVYPIAVGSDAPPRNVEVDNIAVERDAFVRDLVTAKVRVRTMGYPAGHKINVALKGRFVSKDQEVATTRPSVDEPERPLLKSNGRPAEETITVGAGATTRPAGETNIAQTFNLEMNFKAPDKEGTLYVVAEATPDQQEVTLKDNVCRAQIQILDTSISVLYCEGYPRWEYRYLKGELPRWTDGSFQLSCLLFSADLGFKQEGNKPITRFPENMSEMLEYDVVIFGDVDSRQFTDPQLQLVSDFVLKKHGGFGMIAGPKYAPYSFRGTPIEEVLPVSIRQAAPEDNISIPLGWRPVLTKAGEDSTIFRFFEDKKQNEEFFKNDLQQLFWYCRGISAKRDIGEVYAEHPTDNGPDGRKAPILVLGRYGGRTLFSAIDDSWRWRFYTGESIFDTYWIQQLRYLAREKKLGQRRFTIQADRPAYERGEQVQVRLDILDPELLRNPPDNIALKINREDRDAGQSRIEPLPDQTLEPKVGQKDQYIASWRADRDGDYTITVQFAGKVAKTFVRVKPAGKELSNAQVDSTLLQELLPPAAPGDQPKLGMPKLLRINAQADIGKVRDELAAIPSAAVPRDFRSDGPLWDAPLAMIIFVTLITAEWVLRKVYGML